MDSTDPVTLDRMAREAEAKEQWLEADRAYTALQKVLGRAPDLVARHAAMVANSGDLPRATAMTRKALRLEPGSLPIKTQLGKMYLEQKRFVEAEKLFREVLDENPNFRDALIALCRVLLDTGERGAEAEALARRAVDMAPDDVMTLMHLAAIVANDHARHVEAAGLFKRVLDMNPSQPSALHNYGLINRYMGNLEEAEKYLRLAVAARPDASDYWFSLGSCLYFRENIEEALECFRRSTAAKPIGNPSNVYAGYALLLLNRWEEGWRAYENRLDLKDLEEANYSRPRWDGEPLNGETVLIIPEQGVGDNLQFIRYAELVSQKGATCIVVTHRPLERLFQSLKGVRSVSTTAPAPKYFHRYCPVMSLPYTFKTRPDTVPANVPYLRAPEEDIERWRERLSAYPGKRVGLCWRGNPEHVNDRIRSSSLEQFSRFLRVPGISFFSLHPKRPDFEADLPEGMHDIGKDFTDFADTAAAMESLDLVISVDTSVCHLAGAIGRPVWTMLFKGPDFRWGLTGETSAWYPTMRLIRQARYGDWTDVLERITDDLRAMA